MNIVEKKLRTVKKLCAETGSSKTFIYDLLKARALRRYKIQDVLYVSLIEFEALAKPVEAGQKVSVFMNKRQPVAK